MDLGKLLDNAKSKGKVSGKQTAVVPSTTIETAKKPPIVPLPNQKITNDSAKSTANGAKPASNTKTGQSSTPTVVIEILMKY